MLKVYITIDKIMNIRTPCHARNTPFAIQIPCRSRGVLQRRAAVNKDFGNAPVWAIGGLAQLVLAGRALAEDVASEIQNAEIPTSLPDKLPSSLPDNLPTSLPDNLPGPEEVEPSFK